MRKKLLTISAFLCLSMPLLATKVKTWHHHDNADFKEGQQSKVVLTSEGTVQLSRQLKPLTNVAGKEINSQYVWDVVEDNAGNLYVATGGEGRIYRITPKKVQTTIWKSEDEHVLSLAMGFDGNVYAGTGPTGSLIQIDPEGKTKVIAKNLGNYVWDIAVDASQKCIYAATGPNGHVYQISAAGKKKAFCQIKQDHVLSIAVDSRGTVYAGSNKRGLVYRIDQNGKPFVVYQAPQSEIKTILSTANGIYVGTSTPTKSTARRTDNVGQTFLSARRAEGFYPPVKTTIVETHSRGVKTPHRSPQREQFVVYKEEEKASDSKKTETKGKSTDAPDKPDSDENSVYFIKPDGTVREVFRHDDLILSLHRRQGKLYVGTGMKGQLFEIDEKTKETSEVTRTDHGQILCMTQRKDGSMVLGMGDPGKLFVLRQDYVTTGTLTSEVLDAKIVSRWGTLRWEAKTPQGTSVKVSIRTGNVEDPDETWSAWSKPQSDPEKATISAPSARFLQYRVTLATEDPRTTPELRGVILRYQTTNQAPEMTKLEVPNLNAEDLVDPKKLKLKWDATDPNEDRVEYNLFVRKDGWQNWVLLEESLDKTSYTWSTEGMPSGTYRVKVTVSDRVDNPESEALTASKTSVPVIVSHENPLVSVKVTGIEKGRVTLEAKGYSRLVRLTQASFAINGKAWTNVFPTDKLFDNRSETLKFQTSALKPGTYVVVLKMKDAAGNTGSGDVVFTVKEK